MNTNIETFSEKEKKWAWVGIPFKLSFSTYNVYDYQKYPINEKYANFRTLEELHEGLKNKKINIKSPTACYFNGDSTARDFYHDQQDCVIWYYNDDGSISTDDLTVANSLPEFLSHISDDADRFYQSIKDKTFFK